MSAKNMIRHGFTNHRAGGTRRNTTASILYVGCFTFVGELPCIIVRPYPCIKPHHRGAVLGLADALFVTCFRHVFPFKSQRNSCLGQTSTELRGTYRPTLPTYLPSLPTLPIHPPIYLPIKIYLPTFPSTYLPPYLPTYRPTHGPTSAYNTIHPSMSHLSHLHTNLPTNYRPTRQQATDLT